MSYIILYSKLHTYGLTTKDSCTDKGGRGVCEEAFAEGEGAAPFGNSASRDFL